MNTDVFLTPVARLKRYAFAHKFISSIVLVIAALCVWWAYAHATSANAETTYMLGVAQRGTIISSVSGSGQVSASNQVDVKPAAAGELILLNAKAGQTVGKGALLAETDPGNSAFELQSAQLSYDKLKTIDPGDLGKAQDTVKSGYSEALATLTTASTDLANSLGDIDAIFGVGGYFSSQKANSFSSSERAYRKNAQTSFFAAQNELKKFSDIMRSITIESDTTAIQAALAQGYQTAQMVAQAAKDTKDAVALVREQDTSGTTAADDAYAAITATVTKSNGAVSNILSSQTAIKAADVALAELQAGPDTLDVRNDELTIAQKQQAYDDHFIRAPFSGVVASVAAKVGDTVASGDSVATIITKEQVAEISLNEIDAAKVKVGDKATLTFDAVEELTLTGTVAEMDLVGTVTQGVVSYTVKIALDTQDERIRPGMTVNASIITDTKQDVLIVPSSAVKTQNGTSYVQAFVPELAVAGSEQAATSQTPPQQVPVETGISDDTNIEILSGLSEGQQIVTRINSATAATASTASNASRRAGGLGGGAPVFIGR